MTEPSKVHRNEAPSEDDRPVSPYGLLACAAAVAASTWIALVVVGGGPQQVAESWPLVPALVTVAIVGFVGLVLVAWNQASMVADLKAQLAEAEREGSSEGATSDVEGSVAAPR